MSFNGHTPNDNPNSIQAGGNVYSEPATLGVQAGTPASALRLVNPATLQPHPDNYNLHPPEQITELKASLAQFSQVKNVVTWRGLILAGHGLVTAALEAGLPEIEARDVSEWPPEKAVAYLVADNETARMGQPDYARLQGLVNQAREAGVAVPGVSGERLEEIAREARKAGKGSVDDPGPQIDRAAELQVKWGTALGQVWELGEHRIVCGDCTDAAVVEMVMRGERAALVASDPPYNVGIEYGDDVDDRKRDEDYESFSRAWFGLAQKASDRQVVTPGYYNLASWMRFFEKPYHVAPWTKTNSMTRGHVSQFACFEPVLFYGSQWKRERANDVFNFPVSEQSLANGEKLTPLHPCPKPLAMWLNLLDSYTDAGDIITDFFLGSGTTIMACQQAGRVGRGIEIDPGYLAVTLERFHVATQKDPRRP